MNLLDLLGWRVKYRKPGDIERCGERPTTQRSAPDRVYSAHEFQTIEIGDEVVDIRTQQIGLVERISVVTVRFAGMPNLIATDYSRLRVRRKKSQIS